MSERRISYARKLLAERDSARAELAALQQRIEALCDEKEQRLTRGGAALSTAQLANILCTAEVWTALAGPAPEGEQR